MMNHNERHALCPFNMRKKKHLTNRIKHINIDTISEKLNITQNYCKKLYSDISVCVIDKREINKDNLQVLIQSCHGLCKKCNINYYYKDVARYWKDEMICDKCWLLYEKERQTLWKQIQEYSNIVCHLCYKKRENYKERFHYDHINMFDKLESISKMVNNGDTIEKIKQEVDKTQLLCIECHSLITDIEKKLGFHRMKINLTKKYNNGKITDIEYETQHKKYYNLYERIMNKIYTKIREIFKDKNV